MYSASKSASSGGATTRKRPRSIVRNVFILSSRSSVFLCHKLNGSSAKARSSAARPASICPMRSWLVPITPYAGTYNES